MFIRKILFIKKSQQILLSDVICLKFTKNTLCLCFCSLDYYGVVRDPFLAGLATKLNILNLKHRISDSDLDPSVSLKFTKNTLCLCSLDCGVVRDPLLAGLPTLGGWRGRHRPGNRGSFLAFYNLKPPGGLHTLQFSRVRHGFFILFRITVGEREYARII